MQVYFVILYLFFIFSALALDLFLFFEVFKLNLFFIFCWYLDFPFCFKFLFFLLLLFFYFLKKNKKNKSFFLKEKLQIADSSQAIIKTELFASAVKKMANMEFFENEPKQ